MVDGAETVTVARAVSAKAAATRARRPSRSGLPDGRQGRLSFQPVS